MPTPHDQTHSKMDLQWILAKMESRLFFDSQDNPNAPEAFAFIVRACNSHDELLEALKLAKEKLRIYREHSTGEYKGGMEHHALMERINATLAKAEGH